MPHISPNLRRRSETAPGAPDLNTKGGSNRLATPRLPRGSLVGIMSLAQSATAAPSAPVVAAICAAEILGLAGFSIVPALLPQFIEAWALTNTQAGWLAGIVSAGYMLAVIPLVSLTDRRPARQLYLASSTLSALSCFGMGLCDSLLPALGFRALAGIAMAGHVHARAAGIDAWR